MKSSTHHSIRKWFLIGFGVRLIFAVLVLIWMALTTFEAVMMYFLDLPMVLVLGLSEQFLPHSLFRILTGGDPFYIPMNLVASLLWGGIFTLVPLVRNTVLRLRPNVATP